MSNRQKVVNKCKKSKFVTGKDAFKCGYSSAKDFYTDMYHMSVRDPGYKVSHLGKDKKSGLTKYLVQKV